MPDESDRHKRTWMAFGASAKIWGDKLLPDVQRNLALIANTIVEFEPVTMLVRNADIGLAKRLLSPKVETLVCPLDDLWIRDTGPVFVVNKSRDATQRKACVDFNFNGCVFGIVCCDNHRYDGAILGLHLMPKLNACDAVVF